MKKRNNDILIRVIMAAEVVLMWFFYFWKNKYLVKYEGEYWGYPSSLYKYYKDEPQILFLLVTATVLIFIGILSYKKISYWTNMAGSLAMLAHVIVVNNFFPFHGKYFSVNRGWVYIAIDILAVAIVFTSIIALINDLKRRTIHKNHTAQSTPYAQPLTNEGYISMVAHVLLLLFTLGIYCLIWIYKTTKYTNSKGEYRSPGSQLLLCMFIPFYFIYWTYKTAQLIDSENTTLHIVLAIFVPIIPPIMLQDKINKECANESGYGTSYNGEYGNSFEQPQRWFCTACGAPGSAEARFCGRCGKPRA